MGAEEMAGQVAYYSFGNLSGSLISIGIGILVYVFVIRTWMMQKNGNTKVPVGKDNPPDPALPASGLHILLYYHFS
ncbi:hypothetical protein NE634_20240, partial [Lacrimispora saccharolytica]|nr:hypothetical protein [Lacrimispora saccharolytica]